MNEKQGFAGSIDGMVRVWDWDVEIEEVVDEAMRGCFEAIRFSEDGKLLVTGSFDGPLRVWDTNTREEIGEARAGTLCHGWMCNELS